MSIAAPTFNDILAARKRMEPFLTLTPLRNYPSLDKVIGNQIQAFVKHENHLPTNSFKFRNGLAAVTALSAAEKKCGVITPTLGNHGQGVALACKLLDVHCKICVPINNNPDKNDAIRNYGAILIEEGEDYSAAIQTALRLAEQEGLTFINPINNSNIIAGAATLTLELIEQNPEIDALVLAMGSGSHTVGAIITAQHLKPNIKIYGVQAEGASAIHDSWHAKKILPGKTAKTFADGIRTRNVPEITFNLLRDNLTDFITVSDAEIAEAIRLFLRHTHNLAEGAGAAGLAGLIKLSKKLVGKKVGVILTGSNIDEPTLRKVLKKEI